MITELTDSPHEGESTKSQVESVTSEFEVPPARAALVKQWEKRVIAAQKFWDDKAFKRMEKCMHIAAEGGDKEWTENEDNYVVPVLNKYINLAVSRLYARNPSAVPKRRRRRLFTLWDGDPASYQQALMAIQPPPTLMSEVNPITGEQLSMDAATGMPWAPDPNAQALVQEVQEAQAYIKMVDGLAETLEILWDHYTSEQANGFKAQMKALVRRVKVCAVGYTKLLFQRELQRHPEIGAQIDDATQQLSVIEEGTRRLQDGDVDETSAKTEELRLLLQKLQADEYVVAREGPIFDFPSATDILVDPGVKHFKTLTGANWIAHKLEMTPEEVEQVYKKKVKGQFKSYKPSEEKWDEDGEKAASIAKVYEIEHKKNCETLAICEGYPDFLREPGAPDVQLERFWTLFPLIFNEIEHKDRKLPASEVWLLRNSQSEINRSREALREHRIAAKPKYAAQKGKLGQADKDALMYGAAHSVVELKSMVSGENIKSILQPVEHAAIDPNVYSVAEHFDDIQRVSNTQEANFGGASSDGSATEASISEQSRTTSDSDITDDLDDFLTELAKAFAQLCLSELSKETVIEIVGPGAVWPDTPISREELVKDLWLEIKAGSSGKPNAAAELQKMERAMPFMLQLPGLPPKPIAERYVDLLDMGFKLEDVYVDGLPSINAINAMMSKPAAAQPATGDPATNPADQGPQGGQNTEKPAENEPGGQPAYPSGESQQQG